MRVLRSKTSIVTISIGLTLLIASSGSVDAQPIPSKIAKIGCSLPLNISFGVEIKRGLEVCVDVINREGGVAVGKDRYALEITIYDNKYKPEPGIAATQRLINVDRVGALVGDTGAAPVLASIPIVQRSGLPYFVSASTEKILDPKYKYVYVASTHRSVDALYPLLLKVKPDIKTAVLAAQDDETGHDMTRKATAILGRGGVKILESFYFPRDMRDYTPVATKVASLKPDFFAIPGFGGAAEKMGLMSKALYDTNWRGSTFVTASPVIKDLVDICARGEAEGLYIPMSDFTILPDPPPLALKIRKAFEQKYGEWREIGPYWTVPLWSYVAALQKAGGFDAAAIDKACTGLEIDTPIGKAKMIKRPDLGNMRYCDTMVTPNLGQLRGSKVVPVANMSIKDAIGEMEKTDGFKGQWE